MLTDFFLVARDVFTSTISYLLEKLEQFEEFGATSKPAKAFRGKDSVEEDN